MAWLAKPKPSCRQATMASVSPQWSLHTAPQRRTPFTSTCTSTTPSSGLRPPAKRTCNDQRCVRSRAALGGETSGPPGQLTMWSWTPHTPPLLSSPLFLSFLCFLRRFSKPCPGISGTNSLVSIIISSLETKFQTTVYHRKVVVVLTALASSFCYFSLLTLTHP